MSMPKVPLLDRAEAIRQFEAMRNALIDRLESGALDKAAYLEAQMQALETCPLKPERGPIHSLAEGLFNYQYYNMMAKAERIRCKDEEYRNPAASDRHRRQSDRCYELKDRETVKILEYLEYQGVEGYYIHVPARYLQGKLVEITVTGVPRAVFHTLDEAIVNRLARAGVFREGLRDSVIKSYIESDY